MAAEELSYTVDFMSGDALTAVDAEAVQHSEAKNVLSSYSSSVDFLAEALQNATDAVDDPHR
jgi:hypothetical protein